MMAALVDVKDSDTVIWYSIGRSYFVIACLPRETSVQRNLILESTYIGIPSLAREFGRLCVHAILHELRKGCASDRALRSRARSVAEHVLGTVCGISREHVLMNDVWVVLTDNQGIVNGI